VLSFNYGGVALHLQSRGFQDGGQRFDGRDASRGECLIESVWKDWAALTPEQRATAAFAGG